ncbi:MAG TPA: ABC transporter substrate-binding protein [Acidimicrobiales bacterium]|nr:ABC transporter substrate-binding protein [Acidimicrobiales bacterium]
MRARAVDPAQRLLLRGYAPLAAILVLLALLVALVPSKAPEARDTGDAGLIGNDGPSDGPTAGGSSAAAPESVDGAAPTAPEGLGTVAAAATCEGGDRQTREPYSPPCLTFEGDNGGDTSLGVTAEKITVTFRTGALPSVFAVAGQVAEKANIRDTEEDIQRTIRAYFDYFNEKFQVYGRTAEVVFYKGQGDQLSEFFGGGAEGANADALRVGQEIRAFADLSVLTVPYAEALVRQKVIAIPPVHMSQRWYAEHAPYTWGALVDCSRLADTLVGWLVKRVAPFNARYAGDRAMRERQRSFAMITPEEPWYQECADAGDAKLQSAGFSFAHRIDYKLDFLALSSEAANMVAQLKDRGITSVVCVCDPILPLFLTTQATQQDYRPEWIVTGSALTDADLLGQIYDPDQWRHAFGLSFLDDVFSGVQAESYRAYKAVRDDEPAFIHDVLYYPVLMFFLGVHMAGPNLIPETFQDGMFRYPTTTGETGTWSFGPGDWTATDDAREVWFDHGTVSPFNNEPGKYVRSLEQRFIGDEWPAGEITLPIQP